jgi:hypothetical protein
MKDNTSCTYYTFEAPNNIKSLWTNPILRKDYVIVGCWSGDEIKYYRNENKVEYINTVTNEVTILNDRTYRIYEDVK